MSEVWSPEMLASAAHRLGEVPLFVGLAPATLDALAHASRLRRYSAGQVLWNEGDPGDSLLVLEAGQLRVSRFAPSGQEAVLTVVEPPTALGELALLDGLPRNATVVAQQPVVVRFIPRTVFLALLRQEPALVEPLLRSLAAMLRAANEREADLLGLDVPGRLAKWLLARAARVGGSPVHPGIVVPLGRTQTALAAELGTTRESLSRALRRFTELKLLVIDGERVTLQDPTGLELFLG